ncbi:MAG TPA: class I SAM-dependent methyltransferase [Candidatus Polarisedimenticolia bacterium]|nr:class I SAM-dependent methyltransferase [Candidatus Polarisedimenticolia bacterium]
MNALAATREEGAREEHAGEDRAVLEEAGPGRLPGRENVYGHRKRLAFIAARLEELRAARPDAPLRVLDFGCGTGVMITRPLARLGHHLTGIDIDPVSIGRAVRLNAGPSLAHLVYVAGRIERQPWDARFDAVVASEVLEHIPDPPAFVGLLSRCLKRDGLLILTVPNGYGAFEIDSHLWEGLRKMPGFWRLEAGWHRLRAAVQRRTGRHAAVSAATAAEDAPESLATLNENSPHCQRFTRRAVLRLFEELGFDCVAEGRSALWSGPIAHTLFRDSPRLIRWNGGLADRLPAGLASGWYFAFRRRPGGGPAEASPFSPA